MADKNNQTNMQTAAVYRLDYIQGSDNMSPLPSPSFISAHYRPLCSTVGPSVSARTFTPSGLTRWQTVFMSNSCPSDHLNCFWYHW